MIRPRLTDYHKVYKPQAELDFAIPFLDEDLPLYVDPFLLWKSPSYQDQSLHAALISSFNHLGEIAAKGNRAGAIEQLRIASECDEIGLGQSGSRTGKRIGEKQADEILHLFERIPDYKRRGFTHFEEIQFFVQGISKDRVSDFTCSFIKSFLVDFTIDQSANHGIPVEDCEVQNVYDLTQKQFATIRTTLPCHPISHKPLILVPRRWLRFNPWLDFEDYFRDYCPRDKIFKPGEIEERVTVLNFNRDNYGMVEAYVKERERKSGDCHNDPLFQQIPVLSAKRHLAKLLKLPTGKTANADREYEDGCGQLLASLLYPHLDFADLQSRTDSNTQIRDVIFYNNRSHEFLKEIFDDYGSRQLVAELKNVREIEREHVNQLNRYLTEDLGRFGIFVTRHELPRPIKKQLIDLWAGQRRCIIALTDPDLAQMVELFETKQRLPLDVLKKKYVEFRRDCPA